MESESNALQKEAHIVYQLPMFVLQGKQHGIGQISTPYVKRGSFIGRVSENAEVLTQFGRQVKMRQEQNTRNRSTQKLCTFCLS